MVAFLTEAIDLYVLHSFQTSSGTQPAFYPVGLGGKAAGT
jgi:hypothetical protein